MNESALTTKQYRVLVVDDDALSRDIVALLLGSEGHETLQAESGEDALRLLASLDEDAVPEILLVDMQMPGESGTVLARHLRQVAKGARLLAMSATAPSEAEREGFDGFLGKPLDLDEFQAMASQQPESQAARAPQPTRPPVSTISLDERIYGNLNSSMPPASVAEIYSACLSDARRRIDLMREQARSVKMTELRSTAHAIKGGAGMVGAVRIANLAAHLEHGVYREDDIPGVLGEMLDACDELERILLTRKETQENMRQSQ